MNAIPGVVFTKVGASVVAGESLDSRVVDVSRYDGVVLAYAYVGNHHEW